ncbi:MAG: hypothetical protein WC654_04480 [Patescibacteria group bacterium]
MSSEAIATLQGLWKNLTFARVRRTIAREPEDVLWISVPRVIGKSDDGVPIFNEDEYKVPSCQTADIPLKDRWRARVMYSHFYGFTDEGIYLDLAGYHELDFDINLTCDWGMYANHMGGGYNSRPRDGQLIAGIVVNASKGRKFEKWFFVTPELKFMIELVRAGKTDLTQERLARKLLTDDYPDKLWALARLVFFNNVTAFVDQFRGEARPHPCAGEPYGRVHPGGMRYCVSHSGMSLPKNNLFLYVHTLSHRLNSPQWWEEVKRLTDGACDNHVGHGSVCDACDAENRAADPLSD